MDANTREILPTRLFSLLWLLLFLLALSPSVKAQFPAHIDTALTYFGPKEQIKENHGPDIKKFLAAVGLGEGYPYCAAFVSYCLDAADGSRQTEIQYPKVRSALSTDFITDRSIDAKKVLRGQVTIPAGSIHIMPKGETGSGHTGFVLKKWTGRKGLTIDANTGTGLEGESERDGQGVWIRIRQIYSSCYFCVKEFTLVKYKDGENNE